VTISAALATTYTGLLLQNPAASTVNLVVNKINGAIIVAPAAVLALGLLQGTGAISATTVDQIQSNIVGGSNTGQGLIFKAATIPTPTWTDILWGNLVSANLGSFNYDCDGEIVIAPGGFLAIAANVTGPTTGFKGSISWEEVALTA
jgi:hypothetical protein